jgi:hypothetical protein
MHLTGSAGLLMQSSCLIPDDVMDVVGYVLLRSKYTAGARLPSKEPANVAHWPMDSRMKQMEQVLADLRSLGFEVEYSLQ